MKILDTTFLEEPAWKWFLAIGALIAFLMAWRIILGQMKAAV